MTCGDVPLAGRFLSSESCSRRLALRRTETLCNALLTYFSPTYPLTAKAAQRRSEPLSAHPYFSTAAVISNPPLKLISISVFDFTFMHSMTFRTAMSL